MSRLTSWLERYLIISWCVIAGCALVVAYWALERRPPFEMQGYTATPATRGEAAYITASVKRDLTRDCAVTFTRYLVDKDKVRHDMGGAQYMTAAALQQMDRDTPDGLRMAVRIPPDMPVGEATLITVLEYRCNPVHALWPIDVLMLIQLYILP